MQWSRMPIEYLTPVTEDRAIEVQPLLADRGQYTAGDGGAATGERIPPPHPP
jgi:hypothetical protein